MWITPKRGVMFVVFISHKNIFFWLPHTSLPPFVCCVLAALCVLCNEVRKEGKPNPFRGVNLFWLQYPATALPSHLEPCFCLSAQCHLLVICSVAAQAAPCVCILRVMFSVCACNMCQPLRGCFSAGFHLILVSRFKHILQSLSSYFKGTNWLFQTFHFFTFLAESQMRRSIPLSCPRVKAGRQLAQWKGWRQGGQQPSWPRLKLEKKWCFHHISSDKKTKSLKKLSYQLLVTAAL